MDFNNVDCMLLQGHDFLPAVDNLVDWLREYRRDQRHSYIEPVSFARSESIVEKR
jgi:hypothetical protein